jgi:probable HAF family extracellular repeat protein
VDCDGCSGLLQRCSCSNAQDINNRGEIVGTVGSADNTTQFAAIWHNGALTNLGILPGDLAAIASGINDRGQVVGSTWDAEFNWSHGFIYQDGVMTDLNTLFPASSNLFATMANKINERGQISGMATVLSGPHAGDIHAFLATPVNESIDGRLQTSHVHTRNPICPRMLTNNFCGNSDSAKSSNKGIRSPGYVPDLCAV